MTVIIILMELPSKRTGIILIVIGLILSAIAIPIYIPIFNFLGLVALIVGICIVFPKKHK